MSDKSNIGKESINYPFNYAELETTNSTTSDDDSYIKELYAAPEILSEDDLEVEYARKPEDRWDSQATCKFCVSCGSAVPMLDRFCPNCGASFGKEPTPLGAHTPIACVYASPDVMQKGSKGKTNGFFAKIFKRVKNKE